MEVDRDTHHPGPVFSFSLDASAKSCGMYASGFPDLNHLDLWLLGVLLSVCTLQQGIRPHSPKVVGERLTKIHKGRWSPYHVAVMCGTHTFPCAHGTWQGLCAVCACKGHVAGQRGVLGPLGRKVTGHKLPEQHIQTTGPSLGQAGGSQGTGYRFE